MAIRRNYVRPRRKVFAERPRPLTVVSEAGLVGPADVRTTFPRSVPAACERQLGWRIASRSSSWRRTLPQTWSQSSNTLGSLIA